ncbi:MAG: M48 family metallopeptidase [Myxococcales bacterium]|nr:M48 family metallopeptidase [Myxococcales bacterium]
MGFEVTEIRARRDRELFEALRRDRGVEKALARYEEKASGYGFRHRRALLAESIRLSRHMAPQVSAALADCRDALGFREPVEVFLRPEPVYGAFCARGRSGPLVVGLTARLLDEFSPEELRFVMGHELGHALFRHHDLPMPITATIEDIGGTLVSRAAQLKLYVWCRAAEVSADRAGLLCCRDADVAATAFFKLASGLARPSLQVDLQAFASQIEAIASAPSATIREHDDDTLDCFSTHPYTPVRVRALLAFARSAVLARALGRTGGDMEMEEVERVVEADLALMEPSYLEETTPESERLRRALYLGGVAVAQAHEGASPTELHALRALLGARAVAASSGTDARPGELEIVLAEVRGFPLAKRAQLVQHLTVIAGADGQVDDAEYEVMAGVASALDVPQEVIDQTLRAAAAPMD